jgi:hypothetical protein
MKPVIAMFASDRKTKFELTLLSRALLLLLTLLTFLAGILPGYFAGII